jgi:hypothetical protein
MYAVEANRYQIAMVEGQKLNNDTSRSGVARHVVRLADTNGTALFAYFALFSQSHLSHHFRLNI